MFIYYYFFFSCYGDHRDLHVLTHSFPTRRSSDLVARRVIAAIHFDQIGRVRVIHVARVVQVDHDADAFGEITEMAQECRKRRRVLAWRHDYLGQWIPSPDTMPRTQCLRGKQAEPVPPKFRSSRSIFALGAEAACVESTGYARAEPQFWKLV